MLNKEKIENDLKVLSYTHPQFSGIVKNTLEYIEQQEKNIKAILKEQTHKQDNYCQHFCNNMIERRYLEIDKQNLIEKLEKDKEKFKEQNADGVLQDYIEEILEILKGNKNEN